MRWIGAAARVYLLYGALSIIEYSNLGEIRLRDQLLASASKSTFQLCAGTARKRWAGVEVGVLERQLRSYLPPERQLLADRLSEAAGRQVVAEIQVVVVEQVVELEPDLEVEPPVEARVLVGRQIHFGEPGL